MDVFSNFTLSTKYKKHHRISLDYSISDYSFFSPVPSRIVICNEAPKRKSDVFIKREPRLPFLKAGMYAAMLEDALKEMQILCECNNRLRILKTHIENDLLRRDKFGVKHDPPELIDSLDAVDPKNLESDHYKLAKLFDERNFMNNVCMSTYLNLALEGDFKALSDYNTLVKKRHAHNSSVVTDNIRHSGVCRDLKKQLSVQRRKIQSAVYEADQLIFNLKKTVDDSALVTAIGSRYVENWEGSLSQQNERNIMVKEQKISKNIEDYRQRLQQEQRVHAEVELISNIAMNDLLNKTDDWMIKFDEDMEKMELQLEIKRKSLDAETERRIQIEKILLEHGKEIRDWIDFKEEREKIRLYKENMLKAAIVVQAWWRGLLVRLGLGPYKVVKKKGKPKPGPKK